MQSYDFDIFLTYAERFAATIQIAAYILLFISAQQAENTLRQQQAGIQPPPRSQRAPRTVTNSTGLRVIAFIILATIALIRLKEREQAINAGTDKDSLIPNINITVGAWLTVIASIILYIGVKQREAQLAQVTII